MKDETPKDDDPEKTRSGNSSVRVTNEKADSAPNAEVFSAIFFADDSDRTSGPETDKERTPVVDVVDPTKISAAEAGNAVSQQPLPNNVDIGENQSALHAETAKRRSENKTEDANTVGSEPEPIPIDNSSANTANSTHEDKKKPDRLRNWFGSLSRRVANMAFSSSRDEEGIVWTDVCCDEKEKDKAKWFWRIGYKNDDEGNPFGIAMDATHNIGNISPEAKQLLEDIETASVKLHVAFRKYPSERKSMFRSLKETAVIGLCGETPDPELARVYFNSFKNIVPAVTGKVRKEFLMGTIWWSLLVSLIAFTLFLTHLPMHSSVFTDLKRVESQCSIIDQEDETSASAQNNFCKSYPVGWALQVVDHFFPKSKKVPQDETTVDTGKIESFLRYSNLIMGLTLAIIGGSIGLMLIGFLRNREITYESFDAIYQYGMSPGHYLLLIIILSLVVMMLVVFNVVTVGVGGVILNDVWKDPRIGLIIGLLSSISEPLISNMVINQIKPTMPNKNVTIQRNSN